MSNSYLVPGVLERIDPTGDRAPAVFDSPHSGNVYPDDFRHAVARINLRKTEDAFVDELFGAAPEHGGVLLRALFPRSYIDPNRAPDDVDPSSLDGEWEGELHPGEKSRLGVGLIAVREPGGDVYDRKLTVEEVRHRLDSYYWPYHRVLEECLDDVHRAAGAVWHVNCHSMPAMSTSVSPEGPGIARPDFCLGTRDGSACDRDFAHAVEACLSGMGYGVTTDDPYKGVELVRRYSDPARGRHSLQIEVNRALYMDEERIAKSERFAQLRADLTRLVETVCDYARSNARLAEV